MSAPFKRHYATARSGNAGASGMRMALDCARNVYEAVDRRMPEAAALANWLRQSAGRLACLIRPYRTTTHPAGLGVAAFPCRIGARSARR
jgi:hypothetical protein